MQIRQNANDTKYKWEVMQMWQNTDATNYKWDKMQAWQRQMRDNAIVTKCK